MAEAISQSAQLEDDSSMLGAFHNPLSPEMLSALVARLSQWRAQLASDFDVLARIEYLDLQVARCRD